MSSKKDQNKGVLFIFLSALFFGTYGVWSRLIGQSLGAFFQGWTRGLAISLILFPILLLKKQIVPVRKKDFPWLIVFLIFTSLTQAPIFYAFNHMDIGSASLLFFVSVLITMYFVGFIFLKEKPTMLKFVSFVLAIFGLYLMFSFSIGKFTVLAALMAILNGIASGGEISFSKKLTGSYSPLYVNLMSWLVIIPSNGLLSIIFGERQILPSFNYYWFWQLCFIFVSLFAFWFVIVGLKYVDASIGGLIGLLEVIFSVLFGVMLFQEQLNPRLIFGAILIVVAAAIPHIFLLIKKEKIREF